ncbi:MAG: precorrin-6y C5,15-methyltransferase (decarboxylating) subunit CbiE [Syntrophales bacterium]
MKNPSLIIAGCGPGSPDYLTPAARNAIEQAEVLVGASRLLELFPNHEGEKIPVGADIKKVLGEIDSRSKRRIVVLVTGDPGLCSLAAPILKHFGRNRCEVIPGVSSIQAAFAAIGIDWLDARIIDAHGENPRLKPATLTKEGKIAVFAGRKDAIAWVVDLAKAIGKGRRIYLCENLTLDNERVRQVEPGDLEKTEASSRTIVLIIKEEFFR